MSLCDTCRSPGVCCREMWLSHGGDPLTVWDDEDAAEQMQARAGPAPFVPLRRLTQDTDPKTGRVYSSWTWSCPRLGPDGRCTIYEDRPRTCRDYREGSDPLCVMHES